MGLFGGGGDDDDYGPEHPDECAPGSCDYHVDQDGTEHMSHDESGKSWTHEDGEWKADD